MKKVFILLLLLMIIGQKYEVLPDSIYKVDFNLNLNKIRKIQVLKSNENDKFEPHQLDEGNYSCMLNEIKTPFLFTVDATNNINGIISSKHTKFLIKNSLINIFYGSKINGKTFRGKVSYKDSIINLKLYYKDKILLKGEIYFSKKYNYRKVRTTYHKEGSYKVV